MAGTVILIIATVVALTPSLTYTRESRTVLYVLVATFPAILFTSAVASKLKISLAKMTFTAAGQAAFFGFIFMMLEYVQKPEEHLAIYRFRTDLTTPMYVDDVELNPANAATAEVMYYVSRDSNALIVRYPDASPELNLVVQSPAGSHHCVISYAGARSSNIYLPDGAKSCTATPPD